MSRKTKKLEIMKNVLNSLILLLFVFMCADLFSQEIKYSDLSGSERPKGEITSYVGKDGAVYKIGDRIKIGVPSSGKTFTYITEGDGMLIAVTPLLAKSSGQETEIKKIIITGSKRTGFLALIRIILFN
jgi:hypothetical protein